MRSRTDRATRTAIAARRRTARLAAAGLVAAGLVLSAAACTDGDRPSPVATLAAASADSVTVVDQQSASERSIRASRAFFASAPGAVVAPADDADAVSAATRTATRAHVPALLTDEGNRSAVADELARLGARWYQAEGDVRLDTDVERRQAPDATGAPEATRASRPATVVVADRTADSAGVATARAAGAAVVAMPDGVTDPAAAGEVVSALHDRAGHPTVLLGSAFAGLPDPAWTVRAAAGGWQLPHGGQRPFDGHRYVALYGAPGTPALGVLGEQGPAATVRRAEDLAHRYDDVSDTPVTPALEVIATVAAGSPGADGDYSSELSVDTLRPYVDAGRGAGMPVILDLQPGRADFLDQAERYRSLLAEPGVWLALDPEWRLGHDQVPLQQIGSVRASEVDRVSAWLADLVREEGLPPKALVLHQFRSSMVQDRSSLTEHPELDLLVHVDGQGSQPEKQATWTALHDGALPDLHWGWKNFFDEDRPMLTPEQTMAEVHPSPSLITYQ